MEKENNFSGQSMFALFCCCSIFII